MRPVRIWIVCSGNTCRSPMAGGILREMAGDMGLKADVQTAGIYAQVDEPIAKHAVRVMKEIGIDIAADYPKQLTANLVEWADWIVPVDSRYGDHIVERFPHASNNVRLLTCDIPDPYCHPLKEYRKCRDILRKAVEKVIPGLLNKS